MIITRDISISSILSSDSITEEVRNIQQEGTDLFRISNESVDQHGTVFLKRGLRNKNAKNVPVTFGHPDLDTTDPYDVIGKSELFVLSDGVYARVTYNEEHNAKAKDIKGMVRDGYLTKASIRADVYDGNAGDTSKGQNRDVIYFTDWEVRDWGIVMHPSNTEAERIEETQEVRRSFEIEEVKEDPKPEESKKKEENNAAIIARAAKILND